MTICKASPNRVVLLECIMTVSRQPWGSLVIPAGQWPRRREIHLAAVSSQGLQVSGMDAEDESPSWMKLLRWSLSACGSCCERSNFFFRLGTGAAGLLQEVAAEAGQSSTWGQSGPDSRTGRGAVSRGHGWPIGADRYQEVLCT